MNPNKKKDGTGHQDDHEEREPQYPKLTLEQLALAQVLSVSSLPKIAQPVKKFEERHESIPSAMRTTRDQRERPEGKEGGAGASETCLDRA